MWDFRRIENVKVGTRDGSEGEGSTGPSAPQSKPAGKAKKDDEITDQFGMIKAHNTQEIPKGKTVREIGWSKGGEYMVAVGDAGMIAIFKRW